MTWIKICGITNPEDALAAVEAGADALGFVFCEKSPRKMNSERVRAIAKRLPEKLDKIGVFVNETEDVICRTADQTGLTGVQMHGRNEDPHVADLVAKRTGLKIFAAVSMTGVNPQGWAMMWRPDTVHAFLLDSGTSSVLGGTGRTFDWRASNGGIDVIKRLGNIVVAGGLNAQNVAEAIEITKPWGVDVSSGVESKPGKKDPEKIRAFVNAVREADKASSNQMATASVTRKNLNRASHPSKGTKGGAPTSNLGSTKNQKPQLIAQPGRFGPWGGRYVPETLMGALQELEREYEQAKRDPRFKARLSELLKSYAGRPTPLYNARRLSQKLGGAKIYLKREDLLHTGAHKINNCLGQGLLVERMGKHRVVAETGAGQHGVATATVCALMGFECVVYMGTEDMRRQELNVFRMRLLGAEVRGVDSGSRTLKDAINEAMRDWVTNVRTTHYLLGSVLGAHPYPTMVRDFHRVIGREARAQILKAEKKLPSAIIACVGGGSNSIGIFYDFIGDKKVQLIGVEAGGRGEALGEHAARFRGGLPGVLQGTYSYVLQDKAGQVSTTHSVSAGLDYPSIGPEHAFLADSKRAEYTAASDAEALDACKLLAQTEGIIPALESAHAVAEVLKRAAQMKKSDVVIVNISGRGDKDVGILRESLKLE